LAASPVSTTVKTRRWHIPFPATPALLAGEGAGRWVAGLLFAILVTAPAWLPWTSPDLNLLWEEAKGTDDAKHHMLRLFLLEWLVGHGAWYPRWSPDLFMGYGYPVFNYYAPGYYYAGLVVRAVLRQDIWDSYRSVGVLAAVVGAAGTYALTAAVWRRVLPAVLAAVAVLYGPYVFQTNLFQRGAVPEALGLSLVPWLPFAVWGLWQARSPGRRTAWLCLLALLTAALLLTHSLTAVLGLGVAGAWTAGLALLPGPPADSGEADGPRRPRLRAVLLAFLIGAALSAFFWLPAAAESRAVQLEIGQEGHLDYHEWLLDLGGRTEKQQSPDNRQTRGGPLDLHLFYPHQHQFVVTLKPSLAQGALALVALAALPLAWRTPRARRQALLALPFLAPALACWALLFTFSAPLWRLVPALSLMQWPSRMLGPFGICVAVAGAGGLAALLTVLEGRRPAWGRRAGWGIAALAGGAVLLNGIGAQDVPHYPDPKRTMDAKMIVQEEKDSFSHIGTTSGGEFTPRDVQIATYTAGQRRGRSVFERLYPEREWVGGLFQPLAGDLRFLGWEEAPLKLSLRVANDSDRPGRLGVRQFRFPGWRAWVDGRRVPVGVAPTIPEQQAGLGFIVVDVPPGEHVINLALGPTPPRLIGMGLALLGGAALAGTVLWALRRRAKPDRAGALLAGGCLLAVALLAYADWRGLRPAFGRFAVPPAAGAAPAGGVWPAKAAPVAGGALLVNLAEAARAGQARIASPSGAALGRDRFADVRFLTLTDPDAGRGAAGTSRREWLYLHPPSEVSVDVALPAGRTVWFQSVVALDPETWSAPEGDGVRFRLTVTPLGDGDPGPRTVLDHALNPRAEASERRWVPVEADLSPWGGRTVRLTLSTVPGEDTAYDWAGWGDPVVSVRESARDRPPTE